MDHYANLPRRDGHHLTDESAAQLLAILEKGQTEVGISHAGAPKTRGELEANIEIVGAVVGAEPGEDNTVRVRVRLHEHDEAAAKVHEGLKDGSMVVGLDMVVDNCQRPGDGGIVIGRVLRVRRLIVTPNDDTSRYTDKDGTVHDGSRYSA